MFKNNLTKEIVCLLTILAITLPIIGINIAKGKAQEETEQEKLTLELVKEIKFEKSIVDDIGMINIGVITSTEEEKAIRKKAKLSKDEPIFPVRAITIPGKGVVIFDEKGNIKREIKDGCFVSENGEYVVAGNKIKTRENKKALKTKGFRGGIQAISNKGNFVTTEKRDKYAFGRLNFYDRDGNLKGFFDISPETFCNRHPRNMFQLSQNGETFATWDDGELLVFSKDGEKLFNYRILDEQMSRDNLDKIKISPDGRYVVVSCWRGGIHTIYPKDYKERMKRVDEDFSRIVLISSRVGPEGDEGWTEKSYRAAEKALYNLQRGTLTTPPDDNVRKELKKLMVLVKELYKEDKDWTTYTSRKAKKRLFDEIVKPYLIEKNDGKARTTIYLFSRKGELLWSYDVESGELVLDFSPEGDYVGVGDYHNVYLFEARTGRLVWRYHFEDGEVMIINSPITVTEKGEYIAVGVNPKIIRDEKGKEHFKGDWRYVCLFNKLGDVIINEDIKRLTYGWADFTTIEIINDGKQILVITPEKALLFNIRR